MKDYTKFNKKNVILSTGKVVRIYAYETNGGTYEGTFSVDTPHGPATYTLQLLERLGITIVDIAPDPFKPGMFYRQAPAMGVPSKSRLVYWFVEDPGEGWIRCP